MYKCINVKVYKCINVNVDYCQNEKKTFTTSTSEIV